MLDAPAGHQCHLGANKTRAKSGGPRLARRKGSRDALYLQRTIAEKIFGIGAQPPLLMLTATIRSRRQRHRGAQTEATTDELAHSINRTAKVLGVGTTTI